MIRLEAEPLRPGLELSAAESVLSLVQPKVWIGVSHPAGSLETLRFLQ